jgi:chromosomal replication initiation ATPase DnaA
MTALTDNMRSLLTETADARGVPAHRLLSQDKRPAITSARRAWWHALAMAGYSYSEIGLRAGYHHTSVMYGVRKYSALAYRTPARAKRVEILAAYALSEFTKGIAA